MKDGQPQVIRRDAYTPPSHWIDRVDLRVELDPHATRVQSTLRVRRNGSTGDGSLHLDGDALALLSIAVDGRELGGNEYRRDDDGLTLFALPDDCTVTCVTQVDPENNTALEGLYRSNGMFCTQCEAEGFRKITYYLDRPDVMARFRTTVVADADHYPVLLANGNEVARERLADGRTAVTWDDPFPKPAYLFALVGGNLALLEDSFVTMSGRRVCLRIYSEPHNIDQCDYAMDALKRAMRWDEERFGREYDLDIFMIVAVDHFNMGAMENKGLNIFNTNCVLARADTTTDDGFARVESVVAHEYFHNWSGNRVTCRDWFQLSLKEGFTVYRDQEFSADVGSRDVQRIADVNGLRTLQFPEDAGPMAHSVRPDSYIEISNFYTATVYEKGAEVVRMLEVLLGRDGFRRGTDLYFERHDGQAATCEDFVLAMEDANAIQLTQFRNWYSQAGTPLLSVALSHDPAQQRAQLHVTQRNPTAGADASPLHIPLSIGLLDAQGRALQFAASAAQDRVGVSGGTLPALLRDTTAVLQVTAAAQTFTFDGVAQAPIVSLLRGFSAPVKLEVQRTDDELAFLMLHDADGFSRWDAAQSLYLRVIDRHVQGGVIDSMLVEVVRGLLRAALAPPRQASIAAPSGLAASSNGEAQAMLAAMLTPPSLPLLCEQYDPMPIDALHAAREMLLQRLGEALEDEWRQMYDANRTTGAYRPVPLDMARRSLRNLALSFLARRDSASVRELLRAQFDGADNMTDRLAALRAIVDYGFASGDALRESALAEFLERFRHEALVVDLWLSVQSASTRPGGAARIEALAAHPVFDLGVPNKVRAVYSTFALRNPVNFHAADGAGYRVIGDAVRRLDSSNPQIAARLARGLSQWRRLPTARAALLRAQLEALAGGPALSRDVFEVVTKSLEASG